MTVEEAQALQKAFRRKRVQWARHIGRPYSDDPGDHRPPPGEIGEDWEGEE